MKLLHCIKCEDTIALVHEVRTCQCGKSKGRYLNKAEVAHGFTYNAFYSGPAALIGIANKEIAKLDSIVKLDGDDGDYSFYKGEWVYIRPDKTTVLKVKDAARWNPLRKRAT